MLPFLSILLAVRNEEAQIIPCLESLVAQDYPPNRYEILLGNDASTDQTKPLVLAFAQKHKNIQVIDIEPLGKGKQNVLAQLAPHAQGELLAFTDADMRLPASWLSSLENAFEKNTGVVVGCTTLRGQAIYARLQAIDWIFAQSSFFLISKKNIPVTGIGNNMAVRSAAYWETGGYEKLAFSLTEDFALFKEIVKKNYGFKQLFESQVLGSSQAVPHLKTWLHQRKRWMAGAMQTQFYLRFVLLIVALLLPALVWGLFYFPLYVGSLWLFKLGLQSFFIKNMSKKVGLHFSWIELVLYEFYALFSYFVLLIFYLLPIGIEWKGRRF